MKTFTSTYVLFLLLSCTPAQIKVSYVEYTKSYAHYPTDLYRLPDINKSLASLVPAYAEKFARKKSNLSILPRPHEDTSRLKIEFLDGKRLVIFLPSILLSEGNDEESISYQCEDADQCEKIGKDYIKLFKKILTANGIDGEE